MSNLGVHFAIDQETRGKLLSFGDDAELREFISDDLEQAYFAAGRWFCQTDKAWDAIHRSLTDGRLTFDNGEYPLSHCIVGGRQLYGGDDYLISLKEPDQIRDIAKAVAAISEEDMRRNFFAIDPEDFRLPLDENCWQYTWSWFQGVVEFYQQAAQAGRAVIFTVDL